jgi:hypothetical protein
MRSRPHHNLLAFVLVISSPVAASVSAGQKPITQREMDRSLVEAVKRDDLNSVGRLLISGADPNARELLFSKPSREDHDPGNKPYFGDTALILASAARKKQMVDLLLKKGADVNRRGQVEYTALFEAVSRRHPDIVKLLLDRGAKVDLRNGYGDTVLVHAANDGETDMVKLLLDHGANINGGTGWTPLMQASYNGWEEVVRILIRRGADVNFRRKAYMSALECAQAQGNYAIATVIRKAGGRGESAERQRARTERDSAKEINSHRQKQYVVADRNKAERQITDDDTMIVETVLIDLISYRGKEFDFGKRVTPDIVLFDTTPRGPGMFMDSQLNSELEVQKANDISLEMRESLSVRNPEPLSLKSVQFTSPHILIRDVKSTRGGLGLDRLPPTARTWLQVYLPGYSNSRDKAVLRFWFGPSSHGAAGTYFLTKVNGIWKVKWRNFAYFV